MPGYQYKAIDANGRTVRGRITANSETDLEARLKQMGQELLTCREADSTSLLGGKSITTKELLMFCLQMEQMERGGVPLLEGLADLHASASSTHLREVTGSLIAEIENGNLLSQAMARHPKVFDNVFVSLIRTGEQTGKLADVFANLSAMLTWQDELASQTKKLLAYPLFVLVVVLGAIGFLMSYLVPQMAGFLTNMGQSLPWETRALLWMSDIFMRYWWLIVPAPFVLGLIGAMMVKSSPAARYQYDKLKLSLPIVGPIVQKVILARFARYFALMYQTSIPILDALRTSQEIVGNRVVAGDLEKAWQKINGGALMSESFQELRLFPPMVVRMMRLGERTGELDAALLNISYFFDREVKDAVDKMLQVLEPAMTVVLGGMLAIIMYAVLSPVYDTLTKFKF